MQFLGVVQHHHTTGAALQKPCQLLLHRPGRIWGCMRCLSRLRTFLASVLTRQPPFLPVNPLDRRNSLKFGHNTQGCSFLRTWLSRASACSRCAHNAHACCHLGAGGCNQKVHYLKA